MEAFRINITNKFNLLLDDEDLSKSIEDSCYNYTSDYCKNKHIPITFTNKIFKDVYILKSRQLYSNLNKDSYIKNTSLRTLLENNKIAVEKIAYLNYTELFPPRWKQFRKDLEIMNQDISSNKIELAETDQFQCGKCKQRRCTYYTLQIKSADESCTTFINCMNPNCGNMWREG